MRIEGALKTWNPERGIGLIAPAKGGDDVFVHIKAFGGADQAPQVGQQLSFEVSVTWEGKHRARHVRLVRGAEQAGRRLPGARGRLGFVVLPLFLALYLVVALHWQVPAWVPVLYGLTSLACFVVYALDKSASSNAGWRVSHPALLLLGLAGGWPGAIVAQQLLRQQPLLPSFRALFWGTVVLNMLGFALLNSPLGATLLSLWR